MKYLIILIFFYVFAAIAFTQNRHMIFDRMGVDQKFTPSSILSIYQDSKGLIWAGGLAGLTRYDGSEAKWFYYSPQDTFTLNDNRVQCMVENNEGNLWIGTQTGLNYFERKSEKFYSYYADSEIDIAAILMDKRGKLWMITSNTELYTYEPKANRLKRLSLTGKENEHYHAFYEDEQGIIWLGEKNALTAYNPVTGSFNKITLNDNLKAQNIKSITPNQNTKTETFINFTRKDGLLNEGYDAFSYYQSPHTGHLFFEGPQGLDIFHPDSIRPDPVLPNVVFTEFLLSNKTVSVKKDEKAIKGEGEAGEPDSKQSKTPKTLCFNHPDT